LIVAVYLLDTNVISELRRPKPHGAVLAWFGGVREEDLHIAAATLGELQAGIELTRELDSQKALAINAWVDAIAQTYNIIPADGKTFRCWACFMHKRSDDLVVDAMIAATAQIHNFTVVTRNVRDFALFGVRTLNPFLPANS
jgi:predicted nucleic acid-binding protein